MTSRQCDQLIDYFNNQLSEDEKKIFEEHLQMCESCQEELKELTELTEDLPLLSKSEEPPEGMKERVLNNAYEEENVRETDHDQTVPLRDKKDEKLQHPKKRFSPVIYGSLAAALLLSLVGNGILWNERQELSEESQQLMLERDMIESDYEALLAELDEPGGTANIMQTSNLAYAGEDDLEASGTAMIISENDHVDLVIQVTNMEIPQDEDVFQAWVIEGEEPHPTGSFNIDENGNGAVIYRLSDMDDVEIDQIAITLESQPDREEPEGPIILASQ